jgi:hypothetical protein
MNRQLVFTDSDGTECTPDSMSPTEQERCYQDWIDGAACFEDEAGRPVKLEWKTVN